MTNTGLLFSGGKDSSLAALILSSFGFEVTLLTAHFRNQDAVGVAGEAAQVLGLPHRGLSLDPVILEAAADTITKDGFPNNAIKDIHREAIIAASSDFAFVADGTRRDDRVPWLTLGEIRSIEDRHSVEYIAPLRGLGYKTMKHLTETLFEIKEGPAKTMKKGDYETEVWQVLSEKGFNPLDYFPERHVQSRVVGLKKGAGGQILQKVF